MKRKFWIASVLVLIAANFFLYHIDRSKDGGREKYDFLKKIRGEEAQKQFLDEFEKIDNAFTEKNLEKKWIYTSRTDSLWFKRIRVPSAFTLSRYNLFFQKILRDNQIELVRAEEYELSNKLEFLFMTKNSIPARVEIRIVPDIESDLKLSGNMALIIYGLGDSWGAEWIKNILEMPFPYAVSILPGRWTTENIYSAARNNSKTILINLPMEPERGNIDREKYRIMKGMRSFPVEFVFDQILKEMPEAEGIINYRGGKVISDIETIDVFLKEVKKRDLIYVERHEAEYSFSEMLSHDHGVVFGYPHYYFENIQNSDKELEKAVQNVLSGDDAVIMVLAGEENYNYLANVLQNKLSGIELIELSKVLR